MKRDGHIHSPFCPHGTNDSFEQYIEKAISLDFEVITFTEHAPLPTSFHDPTPQQNSAMRIDEVPYYILELLEIKENYAEKIDVRIGLEVDYIQGMEADTKEFLNSVGPLLDDSILSVHFINCQKEWSCVDYSPESFEKAIELSGSVEAVHQIYYEHLQHAVRADLGPYKPTRIGHLDLVKKFKRKFPCDCSFPIVDSILEEIKTKNYAIDVNTAGLRKPLCKEIYPSTSIIREATKLGIPLLFGSDAHQAKEVGADYDIFLSLMNGMEQS